MKLNGDIFDSQIIRDSIEVGDNTLNSGRIHEDISKSLNTYRNWNEFGLQAEPIFDHGGDDADNWWNKDGSQYIGTKAIFNNANAVFKGGEDSQLRYAMNAPLLDSQQVRDKIRERGGCSIKDLVDASAKGLMGRSIYTYSDFMYCKHLGKVSNNYLITLRRFPYPAGDHINNTLLDGDTTNKYEAEVNKHLPDVGRLVTWMGTPGNDLNEILKYKVLMPYKELDAQIQEPGGTAEDGGILGSIMNMGSKDYVSGMVQGKCGASGANVLKSMLGSKVGGKVGNKLSGFVDSPNNTEWAYHRDRTKIYGDADSIAKTHIRSGAEDGGLVFEQEISLCFDYELRAYDGINTRAAMLDLLANILAVTFTNGRFWGGMIRSTGMAQSSVFTNLPIFNMNGTEDYNQIKDKALDSLSQIGQHLNNGQPINGIGDVISMIKNVASNIGSMLLGGALNALGRPQKLALDSLISNNPVGLWHLTIGNPKHPIMSMGNMILSNVEVQQYGPLGLDDFPTGLKVNITVKPAMPRDRLRIEHMYGNGDNRIYMPVGKDFEYIYKEAETYKKSFNVNSKLTSNQRPQTAADEVEAALAQTGTQDNKVVGEFDVLVNEDRGAIDSNIMTSEQLKHTVSEMKSVLMSNFGTDDKILINKALLESHMGSNKAKTTEQSNADAKAAADAAEKQKSENSN